MNLFLENIEKVLEQYILEIGTVWVIIYVFFMVIPTLFRLSTVHQYESHPAVFSRRPKLSYANIIAFLFFCGYLAMNWLTGPTAREILYPSNFETLVDILNNLFYFGSLWAALIIYTIRAWLIHFDIKFALNRIQSKWAGMIQQDETMDWYLKNKQRYGRFSVFKKRAFVLWVIMVIIELSINYGVGSLNQALARALTAGLVFVITALNILVHFRTPCFDDVWEISREFALINRVLFFGSLFACAFAIVPGLPPLVWRVACNGVLFVTIGVSIFMCISMTLRRVRDGKSKTVSSLRPLTSSSDKVYIELTPEPDSQSPVMVDATLPNILSNVVHVNLFMEHLMTEFSHENLLFAIEIVQLKNYLLTHHFQSISTRFAYRIDPDVPISEIVKDMNLSSHDKARKIAEKYIRQDAWMEVNLSFSCRERILRTLDGNDELTEQNVHDLFDGALGEIISLLRDSHRRYSVRM